MLFFFRTFIAPCILDIKIIYISPLFDKPCLNANVFNLKEENIVECDRRHMWYQWVRISKIDPTINFYMRYELHRLNLLKATKSILY